VGEPAIERDLRRSIPQLTRIEDRISRAVQQQYEDHPYPRWSQIASTSRAPADLAGARDVLIAGCGTGRHAIEVAMQIPAARILAIDLSLASLSYAVRKAREGGIENVEFAQADILELGAIGRTFDYIDSSGVLHHMADPWAGWRALIALLRPGGVMRIGLYSELARRPLAAIRSFIAERAYGSSTEDIRRFRQDILQQPDLVAAAAQLRDFYTISNCRDLLFHVQERRMTIPEIKEFLAQHGLEFAGFAIADAVRWGFQQRFGGKADTDLDCWHIFEQEHPAIFMGMYQFGVRKR
jgi:SAM-dependent methyltransferase